MKLLGIDYGTKRIGIAYADSANDVVVPLETIPALPEADAIASIRRMAQDRGVERMILGLPLNFKLEETEQCIAIRAFGERLHKETGIEVIFANEVLSTDLSKRMTPDNTKDDAIAAQVVLGDYLVKYHEHLET